MLDAGIGSATRDLDRLLALTLSRPTEALAEANRMLAHVRRMLAWAVERGILEVSPAAGVRAPGETKSRDRVLRGSRGAADST